MHTALDDQTYVAPPHVIISGTALSLRRSKQLVVQMAEKNPTWGYRRMQGGLANLGHPIDAITVRNILRRHHWSPLRSAARWA